jgi:hypothetical protein
MRRGRKIEMRTLLVLASIATAGSLYADPPTQTNAPAKPIAAFLDQPLSAWTGYYGDPKSNDGVTTVFQTPHATAYVVLGKTGLAECASFVANNTDINRLVEIVREVCRSADLNYKDDAQGPNGTFHRYESQNGAIRAVVVAKPPQLLVIVQTKDFGATDNSPYTAALWK